MTPTHRKHASFDQNKVVGTASATGAGSTTVTVQAPSTAGSYAWKAAWYGSRYTDPPSASSWVADAQNSDHGYRTVALSTFKVAAASAASASLPPRRVCRRRRSTWAPSRPA